MSQAQYSEANVLGSYISTSVRVPTTHPHAHAHPHQRYACGPSGTWLPCTHHDVGVEIGHWVAQRRAEQRSARYAGGAFHLGAVASGISHHGGEITSVNFDQPCEQH